MSVLNNAFGLLMTPDAAAPSGYNVERSLRFNSSDSAFCSRVAVAPTDATKFTLSFWVKRSKLGAEQVVMYAGVDSANKIDRICFLSNDTIELRQRRSNVDYTTTTSAVFRDCSAWYHIVYSWNNGTRTLYVNGVSQSFASNSTTTSTYYWQTSGVTQYLGRDNNEGGSPYAYGDFFLADIHFIDGQALDPSSFVVTSATTGQLIPKQYTGSFGTNGFWLKFSDNSAATATTLGKDYSGNSNNWTPNNFSVLSSYTDTFLSRKPDGTSWTNPTYAFDGTTANYADGTAGNGTVSTIRFNKPLTGVTLLEYFYDGTSTYGYNSTDVGTGPNLTGGSWVTVYSGSAITVNNVRCTSQPGNGVIRLYAIRVNGTILNNWTETDPPGCDSTVDTPTSYGTDTGAGSEVRGNYATLNPLKTGSGVTLSNGNLDYYCPSGTNYTSLASIGMSSGKWYCEYVFNSGTNPEPGIAKEAVNLSGYLGSDAFGWMYYGGNGNKYTNGSASAYGATYGAGDVIGIAFDADNGTLVFYKNGVSQGTAFTGLTSGPYFFAVGANDQNATFNFGQRQWAYAAPAGFKALCDTNLPTPTVIQPNTAMNAVTWNGNGGSNTISGLQFAPDLVWGKCRSNAYNHQLYDAVRGAGLGYDLRPNATSIEGGSSANLFGYLTAFNSDGFSVASGSSNNNYWSGTSETYVAWAWDAGTTAMPLVYGAAATVANNAALATTLISTASPSTVPSSYQNYDIDLRTSVTSAQIKFTYATGAIETLVSADGTTWTSKGSATQSAGATVTVSHTSAFRYIRYHYSSGNWNQGFQFINNTNGTVNSTAFVNANAGFSIVSWDYPAGTGVSTIGHGLSTKPGLIIVKTRDGGSNWIIYHQSTGATKCFRFTTAAASTESDPFNNTEPTSTVFTIGSASWWGAGRLVAYCFSPVTNYSAIGSYVGNGSTDGPFIYTGFRPRWVMIKNASAISQAVYGSWKIIDTSRDMYNGGNPSSLYANAAYAEGKRGNGDPDTYTERLDLLSNGFKLGGASSYDIETNENGVTYIYAAFAENPFQYARAR